MKTAPNISDRQQLLTRIYTGVFPAAAKYLSARGAGLDDAQDIFQDAVVAWYEQCVVNGKSLLSGDEAYIMGIVKNLWRKKVGKSSTEPLNSAHEQLPEEPDSAPEETRLLNYLERAGRKCMELLQGFYYEKLSPAELAGRFGFSGVRSATVQKYKCLEKVREVVKEKSMQYEDFLG
ncbi:MAG: sigma-70 family RNA polymerase sigma factor [Mucilaginibacter polytrichastri]|nr:sigma-70 family RNA polymerase sigma factor [Mucilaginibacter polytrichastri]